MPQESGLTKDRKVVLLSLLKGRRVDKRGIDWLSTDIVEQLNGPLDMLVECSQRLKTIKQQAISARLGSLGNSPLIFRRGVVHKPGAMDDGRSEFDRQKETAIQTAVSAFISIKEILLAQSFIAEAQVCTPRSGKEDILSYDAATMQKTLEQSELNLETLINGR
jgi:hypothetical protein